MLFADWLSQQKVLLQERDREREEKDREPETYRDKDNNKMTLLCREHDLRKIHFH